MRRSTSSAHRVFIIGAGMSKEVGAPLVSEFFRVILDTVAPSRTEALRQYRGPGSGGDLEALLRELDHPTVAGPRLKGYPRVRHELLDGIVEALASTHFKHLHSHFGLRRSDDPYFHDARVYRLIKRVRKKHGLALG
jgi:hypothetical protein